MSDNHQSANWRSFTSGDFLKSLTFWVATGAFLSTVVVYNVISSRRNQKVIGSTERTKSFINQEMQRLHDPKLTDEQTEGIGYLQKKDFFDLVMIIQLKTKLKIQKEVARNQRERVKILEQAMNQPKSVSEASLRETYEQYANRTMTIMQKEFDQYEDQFSKILSQIGISNDTFEASRELYILGMEMNTTTGFEDIKNGQCIENIEKRVYEFLPQPQLPRSLTKDRAKTIMIDVNHRASYIFKKNLRQYVQDNYPGEYEPLIMETLAFDLTFLEYTINESIFRFATHKYELQKDPEVKECLEDYMSS